MFFILLTFAAALFIEGLGSLVSVIGISALFGSNPIIIALAIALDVGKVVVVTLLYTYWKKLPKLMKGYALVAATITMIITSAGAGGYLSGEFQKAIMGTKEGELKVAVLKEQQAKYQERKKQIDDQIASLPEKTTVNQRLRLMNGFKAEQKALDEKINKIDQELPQLQVTQIGTEAKAGPILAIAKSFNIPVEEAVKWVILMIIFVFDPLAVFLIIAGNFLLHQHRVHKDSKVSKADLFEDQDLVEKVKERLPEVDEAVEVDLDETIEIEPIVEPDKAELRQEPPAPEPELSLAPIEETVPREPLIVPEEPPVIEPEPAPEPIVEPPSDPEKVEIKPKTSKKKKDAEVTLESLGAKPRSSFDYVKEDQHTQVNVQRSLEEEATSKSAVKTSVYQR